MPYKIFQKSPLGLLILIGLVLAANLFLSQYWTSAQQLQNQQASLQQYIKTLSNTSASQMGAAIQNDDIESLQSSLEQLVQQDEVLQVSIYRLNGEKIASVGKPLNDTSESAKQQSQASTVTIVYEQQVVGFLISYFSNQLTGSPSDSNNSLSTTLTWSALCVFLVFSFLIFFPQLRNLFKKSHANLQQLEEPTEQPKQLLRYLLQQHKHDDDLSQFYGLLIIKADWSGISEEKSLQVLQFFKRWLPTSGFKLIKLKGQFLQLGMSQSLTTSNLNKLYILEHCLKQIQLSTQILVHDQAIELELVPTLFELIDEGIWCEANEQKKQILSFSQTTSVEISPEQSLTLAKLESIDSQHKTTVERQSRFLLQDS